MLSAQILHCPCNPVYSPSEFPRYRYCNTPLRPQPTRSSKRAGVAWKVIPHLRHAIKLRLAPIRRRAASLAASHLTLNLSAASSSAPDNRYRPTPTHDSVPCAIASTKYETTVRVKLQES